MTRHTVLVHKNYNPLLISLKKKILSGGSRGGEITTIYTHIFSMCILCVFSVVFQAVPADRKQGLVLCTEKLVVVRSLCRGSTLVFNGTEEHS